MTREEYSKLIKELAPENAIYIMRCATITSGFERAESYRASGKNELADSLEKESIERVKKFNKLTPATVKVGDGVTINLWSDRHAEFIPGGFAAHCTNQSEQSYTYEPDEKGEVRTFHWSDKFQRYGQPGNLTLSKGRHEFYDYNF